MYNNKMLPHSLYTPVITLNEYNEKIKTYQKTNDVDMVIHLNTHTVYSGNDSRLLRCDYVAYTKSREVEKGMLIDNHYMVEFVVESNLGVYALLKEIENNGRIDIW